MHYIIFIHSSVDGHLDCFHVLPIVKQYCNEQWGTCVFLNYGFLQIYTQEWACIF